jgi:hypothetical protein
VSGRAKDPLAQPAAANTFNPFSSFTTGETETLHHLTHMTTVIGG